MAHQHIGIPKNPSGVFPELSDPSPQHTQCGWWFGEFQGFCHFLVYTQVLSGNAMVVRLLFIAAVYIPLYQDEGINGFRTTV